MTSSTSSDKVEFTQVISKRPEGVSAGNSGTHLSDIIGGSDQVIETVDLAADPSVEFRRMLERSGSRYKILKLIAEGGFGRIFLAQDLILGRKVVIKSLKEKHLARPESVRKFIAEAKLNAQLDHPAIVPLYSLDTDSADGLHLAMQLIDGITLKEYLKRNYVMVVDTIITNGSAAKNTLIYCALAVLAALIVNPLCAYALSRYKMAPAYKILLFLMLPMAFPPMVLGIPQFLLIKNLNLLNTFWALILPTMANGYMIFLLKGFFDSLPKELFESAAIDGASEWTVFWHIAMGLSTPILSVLALNTFTVAYGNFMMAFLLCQDKSMWTMMVHLYQLQIRSSQAVGFAALIIAAVPTLLVFIFCQNIIIKGIVVPTEK